MNRFTVTASILLVTALAPLHAQGAPEAQASLLEAEQAVARSVFDRGLVAGLEGALAEDAVLLLEGAPFIASRSRIIHALASQPAISQVRLERLPVFLAVSGDGTYGATTGATIIRRMAHPPDSASVHGHYIIVWRRMAPTQPWKIVALLENGLIGEGKLQPLADPDRGPVPLMNGPARLMAEADLAFARLAGDSGAGIAFGRYAAPDATTPPGERPLLIGPEAIQARLSTPARMLSVWAWHPVFGGAAAGGDLGFTAGEATIRSSREPGASVYQGKYLTVWRRQPDGSYKFLLDSGNGRN